MLFKRLERPTSRSYNPSLRLSTRVNVMSTSPLRVRETAKWGAALAAEYQSTACCTYQGGWKDFREDRGGSKVRVLIFEGVIGQTGGRSGAHAGAAHCQLVLFGVEDNVLHVFEPFAGKLLRVKDMIPQSVGNLLADKAKTLTIKLVCGVTADDSTRRTNAPPSSPRSPSIQRRP